MGCWSGAAADVGEVEADGGAPPGGSHPGCVPRPDGAGLAGANVYLVRSGPGWVLIDTAWPHRGQIICAAAESLFGTGTRPAAILLTHIHPDHAGSALELARMWGLPVHVHPGELPVAPGRYLPECGNPLDRWLIIPLLRQMPRRRVEASLSRTSLVGTARAFDPGPVCLACRTGSVSPRRVIRRVTSRSSAAATGC